MDPAYGNHLQRGWTSSRRCKLLWPGQKAWVQASGLGSLGVLGAGDLQTHLGNTCILEDEPERVLMYLPVLNRQGRASPRVGAVGQGEKVVSHEAKLIQRSETKVKENRSQKWQCRELGAALVGICPAVTASPLSAPGGMLPGKETATGKAASPARSYGPMDGAGQRDNLTWLHGRATATQRFPPLPLTQRRGCSCGR